RLSSYMRVIRAFLIFFFFSSRRRHTRCYRDWSSDVCSSDLCLHVDREGSARASGAAAKELQERLLVNARETHTESGRHQTVLERSEERRVGKECRYRRVPETKKKRRQRRSIKDAKHKQDVHQ